MASATKMILNILNLSKSKAAPVVRGGAAQYHSAPATKVTAEDLRYFSQFKGGSVDLNMDSSSGLATLTFNHPAKLNALSGQMMVDMYAAVRELEGWRDGKGVLVHGRGPTFCSGGDLSFVRQAMTGEDGGRMYQLVAETLNRLYHVPLVTAAVIQGHALGGGAEVATACDFRLMAHDARLGFVHKRMGISTAWGGGARLFQLVGKTAALELLTTGCVLTSQQARDLGLAQEVFTPSREGLDAEARQDELLSQALQWLQKRTDGSPTVIQTQKHMVLNASSTDIWGLMARERQLLEGVWGGPDHFKAMAKNIKHKDDGVKDGGRDEAREVMREDAKGFKVSLVRSEQILLRN